MLSIPNFGNIFSTPFIHIFILIFMFGNSLTSRPQSYVETISEPKEWKKILRTRTNILVLYTMGKPKGEIANIFTDVSKELRGTATLCIIDCLGDGKKLCKKNRMEPESYSIKHYKDGDFHKEYDRKETFQSLVTFLRDPSGDLPWDEDPSGSDVFHINDIQSLNKLLKSRKSFMMMFYAPWCGFCKRLKPDYSKAASELKGSYILAAMDVNKPENSEARIKYNITGFPTLIYFQNGALKFTYEGENNKAGIVSFMKNPVAKQEIPKEEVWSDTPSDVVHLTDASFHKYIKEHASVTVMFYAPWCGHCKRMKPEYTLAASALKEKSISGILAAVDATKEKKVAEKYNIKGFPSIKYFKDGEFLYDISNIREKDKIIAFMMDPKEPPAPEKPWAETESAVFHLNEENFKSFLKKKKHVLVMFYVPWCVHCKNAKPEFTSAADKFLDDSKREFAAVDCTQFQQICNENEVRGHPTFIYFNYYKNSKPYVGGRKESDFIKFITDPDNPSEEILIGSPNDDWKGLAGSEHLTHLTASSFANFIKDKSVLIMFYAPWCVHCKSMKGDFSLAAAQLSRDGISCHLATVDGTREKDLASKFGISGYPTLKLFKDGVQVSEYKGDRNAKDLVAFMKKNSLVKEEL